MDKFAGVGKLSEMVECPDCAGTGLDCENPESEAVARICRRCNGYGWFILVFTLTPFTGFKRRTHRKRCDDIRFVRVPGLTDLGDPGFLVPYEYFFAGKVPAEACSERD